VRLTSSEILPALPAWLVCPTCGDMIADLEPQCTSCGGTGPFIPPDDERVWRIQAVPSSGRPPGGRSWSQEVSLQSRIQVDGTWAHVYRFIDRQDDVYLEFVHDHEGREIRHVSESLRQHQGRGSARRRV
jgi:hypothetical protein